MTFVEFVNNFKKNIDYDKVGMILFHNGVVRGTSRDGEKISSINVKVYYKKLSKILKDFSNKKGIFKVDAYAFEGEFNIGDDLLFVGVAGDIRENVFPVLQDLVNKIKKEAIKKEER